MKSISGAHSEWVKINRHLQRVGTATCDVSSLIMDADDCERGSAAQYHLMCAARLVLSERQRMRHLRSARINRPVRAAKARSAR